MIEQYKTGSLQLSIIVPVYNVDKYLKQCLDSLIEIGIDSKEILIVNDGSTDGSAVIADTYASDYEYIHVFHQKNMGLSYSRNRGLKKAKGEYVLFVDSDDWVIHEGIEGIMQLLSNGKVDVAMGNVLFLNNDGSKFNPFLIDDTSICGAVNSGGKCFIELMRRNQFSPMAVGYIYNRSWLLSCMLEFENIVHEDELWTTKALCLANTAIISNIDFYIYRLRDGSIMRTLKTSKRINDLLYISNALLKFACNFSFDSDNRELKSYIYVKSYSLYALAFDLLSKIRDSGFKLAPYNLYTIFSVKDKLTEEARKCILQNYKTAKIQLREYRKWMYSDLVSTVDRLNPGRKHIILLYNTMWETEFSIPRDQVPSNFIFTTDRALFDLADTVVFHIPTLDSAIDTDLEKKEGQLWVAWTLECEENYTFVKRHEFMELFDLWISYHQDADVQQFYFDSEYLVQLEKAASPTEKSADICMFISSPINQSGRKEYLAELMKELHIDSYGKLYNNKILDVDKGRETKLSTYRNYKFVIAFENAIARDYVTEKFYDPLMCGAVPVYLGAYNIEQYAPAPGCYVDVQKFESPKTLADFIKRCCKEDNLYNSFFLWRENGVSATFKEMVLSQKVSPFIRLCSVIDERRCQLDLCYKEIVTLGKIYLCSFADSRYKKSSERLKGQAEDFNLFHGIFIYDERSLGTDFVETMKDHMWPGSRGYGYWVWKPYIILETLKNIQDGDVLVYVDTGYHLNSHALVKFVDYWKEVKANSSGFLLPRLYNGEKKWTKGDLLDYFHVRDDSNIIDTPQYEAGLVFIRKSPKTVSIIRTWLNTFYVNFQLADDTPSSSENLPGFIEHRHDQSILSILLKINGCSFRPLEDFYYGGWSLAGNKQPLQCRRDLK